MLMASAVAATTTTGTAEGGRPLRARKARAAQAEPRTGSGVLRGS